MSEKQNSKGDHKFLRAIAAGISTCIVLTVILAGIGFRIETAFAMAYTVALSVFGALLYRFYRMKMKESPAVGNRMIPKESPLIQRESQYLDKRPIQRCLILAARTHGELQDRANYWLSGQYGTVKSSSLSVTEKGVYMLIFYEEEGTRELPLKQEVEQSESRRITIIGNNPENTDPEAVR